MSLLNTTDIIDNKSDLPSDLEKYLRILLEEKETEIKKKAIETRNQKEREINLRMVNIPEKNYAIQQTEVHKCCILKSWENYLLSLTNKVVIIL